MFSRGYDGARIGVGIFLLESDGEWVVGMGMHAVMNI